jgi:hypothetical protein
VRFPSKNALFKHLRDVSTACGKKRAVTDGATGGGPDSTGLAGDSDTTSALACAGPALAESDPGEVPGENAYLYVVGGRHRGRTIGVTERFSMRSGEWERGPHLNEQRGNHGVACVGQTVVAIGGGGVNSNLNSCEAIDAGSGAAAEAWQPAGEVAQARHALSACAAGGGVYAVGGWKYGTISSGCVDFCDVAAAAAGPTNAGADGGGGGGGGGQWAWQEKAPLLTPRRLHGVAALPDGRVFVFGGRAGDEEPEPAAGPGGPGGPAGGGRAGEVVPERAEANQHLRSFSGRRWTQPEKMGPCAAAERFDPDPGGAGAGRGRWTAIADCPVAGCASAAATRGAVFVFMWGGGEGGGEGGGASGEGGGTSKGRKNAGGVYRYDPDADRYHPLGPLPLAEWFGFAAAARGGCVHLVGGSARGRWTGAHWRLEVQTGRWTELPPMKMVRRRTAACICIVGDS